MIRVRDKRVTRSIYVMRCGYCLLSEAEAGAELTYDHFQPQSRGGSDNSENLVYACHACNEFKGEYFGETDDTRLLHPLRDDLTQHLREEPDGTLHGITPAGQRYIEVLHLNRPPLVLHRRNARKEERFEARFQVVSDRLEQMMNRIQRMEENSRARKRRR